MARESVDLERLALEYADARTRSGQLESRSPCGCFRGQPERLSLRDHIRK